ncbi:MAG: LysM peptidoglycan-binding domain-containing protein, partial [Pseudomonadota bacterium]
MHTTSPTPSLPRQCEDATALTQAPPSQQSGPGRRTLSQRYGAVGLLALALLGCQQAQQSDLLPPLTTVDAKPVEEQPEAAPLPQEAALWVSAPLNPLDYPQPPETVWDRLRDGFSLQHAREAEAVQAELRWLERHPGYFLRRSERLERFLPAIVEQVTAAELPLEIALMPIVESALDPYAFSPGGAAGLWQFIPATADRFKLKRDYWYEARRDVEAATAGAIAYLKILYRRFDDWELALAAYNAGEGTVSRALRRHRKAHGEIRDRRSPFWTIRLPQETRRYVPRILALAAAIEAPERIGIELPAVLAEPTLQSVRLPGQFDLMKVASTLDVPVDELYALNPALNQWATPPDGPHRLYLPARLNAAEAEAALSAVDPDQRVAWARIQVRSGDTLSTLARRHGTDIASIRRSNQLRGDRIRVGQALLIPKSSAHPAHYPIPRRSAGKTHTVVAGDSLWSVSRQYGVTVSQLVRWNELHPKATLRL